MGYRIQIMVNKIYLFLIPLSKPMFLIINNWVEFSSHMYKQIQKKVLYFFKYYLSIYVIYIYYFSRVDAVFLDHLSQDIKGTNSSAVWR